MTRLYLYSLTFKYKTNPNDHGFFTSPVYFDFYFDAVKFMTSIRDLTPARHIIYCHIEHTQTNQTWDFPFFPKTNAQATIQHS
jgi:hypothetical protein